jgi:hypothetical protein
MNRITTNRIKLRMILAELIGVALLSNRVILPIEYIERGSSPDQRSLLRTGQRGL